MRTGAAKTLRQNAAITLELRFSRSLPKAVQLPHITGMAVPSYLRSPFGLAKRLRVLTAYANVYQSRQPQPWHADPSIDMEHHKEDTVDFDEFMQESVEEARGGILPAREPRFPPSIQREIEALRLPRSVQLNYLKPLKRVPTHGVPVCDLQLRSYSVRNLEFYADFALRAAYYLNLPARGPVPLPRITERWTVPRSNFIHKKSQENFERITMRRLIQIQDAHPEAVQIWLGFLQKYAYYGVGMKANVWEYSSLDVGKEMDEKAEEMKGRVAKRLSLFGKRGDMVDAEADTKLMHDEFFRGAAGGFAPMAGAKV
ncbi:mitochondrial 37S ribosomal protein rsm10 [Zalaria obscura]|uniref:Mitochondrial 37S ribosomal protein rsm10 n=1 Tax=Zalaria obscura TaxID=2024903 RepID=A0ACC3SGQ6_9PEZI